MNNKQFINNLFTFINILLQSYQYKNAKPFVLDTKLFYFVFSNVKLDFVSTFTQYLLLIIHFYHTQSSCRFVAVFYPCNIHVGR